MELNMDTLPIRAAGEVFEFIASKLPHSSPPNPYPRYEFTLNFEKCHFSHLFL